MPASRSDLHLGWFNKLHRRIRARTSCEPYSERTRRLCAPPILPLAPNHNREAARGVTAQLPWPARPMSAAHPGARGRAVLSTQRARPPEAALPQLLGRVAELNPRQQRFLLTMLAELEASSAATGTSVRESLGQVQVWKALEAGLNALAKPGDDVQRPASVRSAAARTQPAPPVATSPIDAHNHEAADVSPVGSGPQQAPVAVHEPPTVAVELQISDRTAAHPWSG